MQGVRLGCLGSGKHEAVRLDGQRIDQKGLALTTPTGDDPERRPLSSVAHETSQLRPLEITVKHVVRLAPRHGRPPVAWITEAIITPVIQARHP
jgi:hypothetical protein